MRPALAFALLFPTLAGAPGHARLAPPAPRTGEPAPIVRHPIARIAVDDPGACRIARVAIDGAVVWPTPVLPFAAAAPAITADPVR